MCVFQHCELDSGIKVAGGREGALTLSSEELSAVVDAGLGKPLVDGSPVPLERPLGLSLSSDGDNRCSKRIVQRSRLSIGLLDICSVSIRSSSICSRLPRA